MSKFGKEAKIVFILSIILTIFGVYMVYSASKVWAQFKYNDEFFFLKRQVIFAIIGIFIMFLLTKIDLKLLITKSHILLLTSFLFLILVLIPGIGVVRNGSQSWIGVGQLVFQPSEIFKITAILFVSKSLEIYFNQTKYFIKGVIPILIPSLLGFFLIMLQPDLGTGIVLLSAITIMTMTTKAKFKNYIRLGILAMGAFAILIITKPYRIQRITAFIDPFEDPLGSGFQIIQSLFAIGPGGILGLGIDGSIQKHFFLPEPQTDFIFAIVCEEFGFIGAIILILIFGYLIYYGLKIALLSKNLSYCFMCIGVTSLIGVQVIINLGVVVGLLPVTGITLPFISYGGTSLIIVLSSIGLLINAGRKEYLV